MQVHLCSTNAHPTENLKHASNTSENNLKGRGFTYVIVN